MILTGSYLHEYLGKPERIRPIFYFYKYAMLENS